MVRSPQARRRESPGQWSRSLSRAGLTGRGEPSPSKTPADRRRYIPRLPRPEWNTGSTRRPGITSSCPPLCLTLTMPLRTKVNSSNSGACPGSSQPCGLRMWATLTPAVLVLTRPMYSSISLGLVPAAEMRVGCATSVGMSAPSNNYCSKGKRNLMGLRQLQDLKFQRTLRTAGKVAEK